MATTTRTPYTTADEVREFGNAQREWTRTHEGGTPEEIAASLAQIDTWEQEQIRDVELANSAPTENERLTWVELYGGTGETRYLSLTRLAVTGKWEVSLSEVAWRRGTGNVGGRREWTYRDLEEARAAANEVYAEHKRSGWRVMEVVRGAA